MTAHHTQRESNDPFPIGGDKPLRMKAATLGAIILSAIAGAMFLENIRRDVADQGATLAMVVGEQKQIITEQRATANKVSKIEWILEGRRGPPPVNLTTNP